MLRFQYDWMTHIFGDLFEAEMKMPFKGEGWYQKGGDTILVEDTCRHNLYSVFVWNDRHPLDSVKDLLTFKF